MLTRVNMDIRIGGKMIDEKEVFTIKDLAKIKNCSRQAIHQLALRKGIKFKKLGPIKYCTRDEAQILTALKQFFLKRDK